MAKHPRDIENPILTPIIPIRRPAVMCECGCGDSINKGMDDYIIIDDMIFSTDYCVTNYFIKEAGGRRVYGGAC